MARNDVMFDLVRSVVNVEDFSPYDLKDLVSLKHLTGLPGDSGADSIVLLDSSMQRVYKVSKVNRYSHQVLRWLDGQRHDKFARVWGLTSLDSNVVYYEQELLKPLTPEQREATKDWRRQFVWQLGVHVRDLSPGNLGVDSRGQIVILDVGTVF